MFLAQNTIRQRNIARLLEIAKTLECPECKAVIEEYLSTVEDGKANSVATDKFFPRLALPRLWQF